MEIAFFIFYLLLACAALLKLPFFKKAGLGKWLIGIFLIKIAAGFLYAWFFKRPQNYAGADTWRFYNLSLHEKDWLLKDPKAFIKDLFVYGYSNAGNIFSGENSYWNDLKSNFFVKLMAVMNLLTLDNYYTNIILFNFLFLCGLIGIYRVFVQVFPLKKVLLLISIFFVPSALFWCSGIHKDGLILSAIGMIVYCMHTMLTVRNTKPALIVIMLINMTLIFFMRNYIVFALVPALLCWWLAVKWPGKKVTVFCSIYFAGTFLFFLASRLVPAVNLPGFIVTKHNEFLQLSGGSSITMRPLEPTFKSFIQFLPQAIDIAFLRPHLNEAKNLSYIPASIEIFLLWVLCILSFIYRDKRQNLEPVILFSLFFGLTVLIIAGYTITFSGAIVRYRSIVLPFLIPVLMCRLKIKNYIK